MISKLIVSRSRDPYKNLDTEKRLLAECRENILFLYVNRPSVIVGRNQSIEAEADSLWCACNGIPVIRRISGGGTVYHDPGNVNYSFLVNRNEELFLDTDFLTPVIQVLRTFGIEARPGLRKELLVGDKKISGTAAHITRQRHLFHGTLLYDADLYRLQRALRGDPLRRGRKVPSVRSKVVNLRDVLPEPLSPDVFYETLAERFGIIFGCVPESLDG